jgi:hypothetical protein
MYQLATLFIPGGQIITNISNGIFIAQQAVQDISGGSLIKQNSQWNKQRVLGCVLVGMTILSIALSILHTKQIIDTNTATIIEDIFMLVRAILAVLYGTLIKSEEIIVQPPVQPIPPSGGQPGSTAPSMQPIKFGSAGVQAIHRKPVAMFNMLACTDLTVQPAQSAAEPAQSAAEPAQPGIKYGHLTLLQHAQPAAESVHAPGMRQDTEPLQAVPGVQPGKKKVYTDAQIEEILNRVLTENIKITARDLGGLIGKSASTANKRKNRWIEIHSVQNTAQLELDNVQSMSIQ